MPAPALAANLITEREASAGAGMPAAAAATDAACSFRICRRSSLGSFIGLSPGLC
jgi:hypothetical protein